MDRMRFALLLAETFNVCLGGIITAVSRKINLYAILVAFVLVAWGGNVVRVATVA